MDYYRKHQNSGAPFDLVFTVWINLPHDIEKQVGKLGIDQSVALKVAFAAKDFVKDFC